MPVSIAAALLSGLAAFTLIMAFGRMTPLALFLAIPIALAICLFLPLYGRGATTRTKALLALVYVATLIAAKFVTPAVACELVEAYTVFNEEPPPPSGWLFTEVRSSSIPSCIRYNQINFVWLASQLKTLKRD